MALLVSAKGSDVMAWRAAGDFTATFRQLILDRLEYCRSDEADALLESVMRAVEELSEANDSFGRTCGNLLAEVEACDDPEKRRGLTTAFYDGLYAHFAVHHSAPAFYQFSSMFLQALARSVSRTASGGPGVAGRRMTELALVALGPAGRQEFSPFCPLQLMLVGKLSDDTDSAALSRFAGLVHEGFAACGLRVDEIVTPRDQLWRGSAAEWEQRLHNVLEQGRSREVVDVLRLTDQTFLCGSAETADSFRASSLALLTTSTTAASNIVSRVVAPFQRYRHDRRPALRKKRPVPWPVRTVRERAAAALGLNLRNGTAETVARCIDPRPYTGTALAARPQRGHGRAPAAGLAHPPRTAPDPGTGCTSRSGPMTRRSSGYRPDGRDGGQDSLRESLESVGTMQRHVGLNFSGDRGVTGHAHFPLHRFTVYPAAEKGLRACD